MEMKKRIAFAMFLLVFLLDIAIGSLGEFAHPPEDHTNEWISAYPYQRNLRLQFPVDPREPGSGWAPYYYGTEDESMKLLDEIIFGGSTSWYQPEQLLDLGLGNVVGIDNRKGGHNVTGSITLFLDNLALSKPVKNIWQETLYSSNLINIPFYTSISDVPGGAGGGFTAEVKYNPDSEIVTEWPHIQRHIIWRQIKPNPEWEELRYDFNVPAGGYVFIKDIHITTECVPEPATLLLLGLGAMMLRRKRRA